MSPLTSKQFICSLLHNFLFFSSLKGVLQPPAPPMGVLELLARSLENKTKRQYCPFEINFINDHKEGIIVFKEDIIYLGLGAVLNLGVPCLSLIVNVNIIRGFWMVSDHHRFIHPSKPHGRAHNFNYQS